MIGAAIGAVAGIAGAALSASASGDAADAQAAAAATAAGVQRQNFLDSMGLIEPQIRMGDRARNALAFEMGIGERPYFTPADLQGAYEEQPLSVVENPGGMIYDTSDSDREGGYPRPIGFETGTFAVGDQEFLTREAADEHLQKLLAERDAGATGGFEYGGFKETPGYQFQVSEGQKALERSAAARGMNLSGATLKGMTRYRQGVANQEYGTFLNRLAAMSGAGQTATSQAFQGYQNQGNALSNLALQSGNAQASSYIGQANAWNQGIGNVSSALGSYFGMQPGMITG